MAKFRYKVAKQNGEIYESVSDFQSKDVLISSIKEKSETIISVEEIKTGSLIKNILSFGTISIREKILFARNLSVMIQAGLPLSRSISVLLKQTKNKKLQDILSSVGESIKKGKSLSDSLADFPKVFSKLFVAMTKAGEESGGLSSSLKIVSAEMDQTYQLEKKLRGALVYPIIVLAVMVVVGVLMLVYVVPNLTATFKDLKVELPLSTQIVISVSDFISQNLLITVSLIIILIILFVLFKRTSSGGKIFDFIYLKLPFIKEIVRNANSARMARTMSSLLSAGVPVTNALKISEDVVQNFYFKRVIAEAEQNIQKGVTISSIFGRHENLYPSFVTEMVSVGEETGDLAKMFLEIADFYEDEVSQKMKNISTVIEPVLMVFIGAAVGFFAVSMIAPTYSIMNNI